MSAEQIELLTALIALMKMMSGWPAGVLLLAVVIGPWVMAIVLSTAQSKRFEAVVGMYENNVKLVQDYDSVARDLKEVVVVNCQAMQKVCDKVDMNQYCPIVRDKQGRP